MHRTYLCFWESFIHSLACAEYDDSLPFSGASSVPLYYIPFPSTHFDHLVFHPPSLHLAIYFLVFISALLFPNSYIILFRNSVPISCLQLFPAFSPVYYILISCLQLFCTLSLCASGCLLHSDLILTAVCYTLISFLQLFHTAVCYTDLMLTAVSYIFSLYFQLFITFWSHAYSCLLHSGPCFQLFITFQSHAYSCLLHSGHMLPAVFFYILVTCLQLFITFWSHAYSCLLHSGLTHTDVYYIPVTRLQLFHTFAPHASSCILYSQLKQSEQ